MSRKYRNPAKVTGLLLYLHKTLPTEFLTAGVHVTSGPGFGERVKWYEIRLKTGSLYDNDPYGSDWVDHHGSGYRKECPLGERPRQVSRDHTLSAFIPLYTVERCKLDLQHE